MSSYLGSMPGHSNLLCLVCWLHYLRASLHWNSRNSLFRLLNSLLLLLLYLLLGLSYAFLRFCVCCIPSGRMIDFTNTCGFFLEHGIGLWSDGFGWRVGKSYFLTFQRALNAFTTWHRHSLRMLYSLLKLYDSILSLADNL